jgi:isopenicillin N synthase-like dioxygenase
MQVPSGYAEIIFLPLALEFVTQGLARATSHRVLSPPKGSTPRYSVPFFQNISLNVKLPDEILQCMSPSDPCSPTR